MSKAGEVIGCEGQSLMSTSTVQEMMGAVLSNQRAWKCWVLLPHPLAGGSATAGLRCLSPGPLRGAFSVSLRSSGPACLGSSKREGERLKLVGSESVAVCHARGPPPQISSHGGWRRLPAALSGMAPAQLGTGPAPSPSTPGLTSSAVRASLVRRWERRLGLAGLGDRGQAARPRPLPEHKPAGIHHCRHLLCLCTPEGREVLQESCYAYFF